MDEDAKNAKAKQDAEARAKAKELADYVHSLDDMQQIQAKALVSIFSLMYVEKPTTPNEKFDILKLMLDVYRLDLIINLAYDLLKLDEEELREQLALLGMNAIELASNKARIIRNYANTLS